MTVLLPPTNALGEPPSRGRADGANAPGNALLVAPGPTDWAIVRGLDGFHATAR